MAENRLASFAVVERLDVFEDDRAQLGFRELTHQSVSGLAPTSKDNGLFADHRGVTVSSSDQLGRPA